MEDNDNKSPDYGTWSQAGQETPPNQPIEENKMSRRGFLGRMGAGVASTILPNWLGRASEQQNNPEIPMPSDIISREELETRFRTKIHDLPESEFPDSFVELNFRRGIENVQLFQMLEGDNPRLVGLDIILVNGDYIDPAFFTPEQNTLMQEHPIVLSGLERQMQRIREQSADLVMFGYSPTVGTATNDRGEHGPRNFIFLAVRGNHSPNPTQSYPTPEDFEVTDEPDIYGYVINTNSRTAGSTLRHEMQHSEGVYGEPEADHETLEGITEAANHMAETGSDEKYWAVFRTPEGVTITHSPESDAIA